MDEVFLASLSRIPGVGKRKGRVLLERFPTIEALRAASAEEIDALPGIGPALARRLKEFADKAIVSADSGPQPIPRDGAPPTATGSSAPVGVSRDLDGRVATTTTDKDWLKDFVEIAALFDEVLPTRSAGEGAESAKPPLSESRESTATEKVRPQDAAHTLNACPRCGALFGGGEETCSRCGVALVDASDRGDTGGPPTELREARPPIDQAMGVGRISDAGLAEGIGREGAMMHPGRVNGLARGTGRVNGLARDTGRVNGLASRVGPGQGMVNGLINGNGITNGHARRHAMGAKGLRTSRRRRGGLASILLVILVISGIGVLLYTPPPRGGIVIDGVFGDWAGVARYDDPIGDSSFGLDLSDYRIQPVDENLLVYARTAGSLWGLPNGQTESVFAFVDEDGNSATGFQVGGIGAESAAEFFGWDGNLMGSQWWQYAAAAGPTSDDWRSFHDAGSLEVASAQNQIEARIVPGPTYSVGRARVLFHTWSSSGQGDTGDAIIGRPTGAVAVFQRTIAADILNGTREPFLLVTVRPLAAPIGVAGLTVQEYGSLSPGSVAGSLYLDKAADGKVDPTDPILSSALFSPEGKFAVNRTLNSTETYLLRADFRALPPGASVGFRVVGVSLGEGVDVPVTIAEAETSMSYLLEAPKDITVDGAFADWNAHLLGTDADDDVRSVSGSPFVNENIDLRAHAAVIGTDVSVYLRVDGRVLGGVDIPNFRGRSQAPREVDSDGDTVPDEVEASLGPILREDFNNDNVSDAVQTQDVDQDGVLDYNKCFVPDCAGHTDYWLETTIPAWYPSSYAGKSVRRYVGPVSPPPQRGVDTAIVYIDRDNRTDTGLLLQVGGVLYGMDYAYQATGRGGSILEAGVYAYNGSRAIPWEKIATVTTGIDAHRLEASFPATLVSLTANHTFLFSTTDWRSNTDTGLQGGGLRGAPIPKTRSSNDPRTFDIPGNQKLYLRNTNHATETDCTTNKVASSTQGSGPAASLVLGAGQTACWYADGTAGTFIPAGDWETLLDLFLSHGIVVYGEGTVATPRYRESDGRTFGSEASANAAAATISWVVVASSPTSPEKIVGVLASTGVLYIQTWDGATWVSNWNQTVGSDTTRGFDIAYEEQSADVMVAFADQTSQLRYRKRVAGTWDGTNGSAGVPLADIPHYVRLTSRPTNNDIMAAVSTNANTLHALRWNGTADTWGDQVQNPGLLASKDQEAFDVAYERASGNAVVIWGNDGTLLRYRSFSTGWGATATAYTLADRAIWVTAAADPAASSNRIAVGMILNTQNAEFGAWNGSSWVTRPAAVTVGHRNERRMDVGFEASGNRAMFVFSQLSNEGQIAWRTWTESGGFSGVTIEAGVTARINFIQVRPDPRSNAIMVMYADNNGDLFYRRWDGSAWSSLPAALEINLSQFSRKEAFMFAWTRLVEYDVYLEIWDTVLNSVFETIGSCLNQKTYGDDVQCLVSGVGPKLLTANQVVRIRVAHSSPGATFGILFDNSISSGDSRATIPTVFVPEFEIMATPLLTVLFAFGLRRRGAGKRRSCP